MTGQDGGEVFKAVLQNFPFCSKPRCQCGRFWFQRKRRQIAFGVFQNTRRAGGTKSCQLRRQNTIQRGLARMDGFGHVAGFKEGIQPRCLRTRQAQGALHTIRIQPHGMGSASSGAESPIGRGGMPETIMRWHHRHADTHGNFIPCYQRRQHGTP